MVVRLCGNVDGVVDVGDRLGFDQDDTAHESAWYGTPYAARNTA
ncbi:hypothetical protein ACH4NT_14715 [Streptomyces lydicus]